MPQKRAGSLSPSSRLSQAIRLDLARAAAHPAHATVLPAPGGAVITVTGRSVACSISAVRRSLCTTSAPAAGTRNLPSRSAGSTVTALSLGTDASCVTRFHYCFPLAGRSSTLLAR